MFIFKTSSRNPKNKSLEDPYAILFKSIINISTDTQPLGELNLSNIPVSLGQSEDTRTLQVSYIYNQTMPIDDVYTVTSSTNFTTTIATVLITP